MRLVDVGLCVGVLVLVVLVTRCRCRLAWALPASLVQRQDVLRFRVHNGLEYRCGYCGRLIGTMGADVSEKLTRDVKDQQNQNLPSQIPMNRRPKGPRRLVGRD